MPNLFRFVTDAVKQFEYGSADQNQYGNHIWTPELEELYGAQKGDTFIGRDADGNPAEYHMHIMMIHKQVKKLQII